MDLRSGHEITVHVRLIEAPFPSPWPLLQFTDAATPYTYVDILPPSNNITLATLADQALDQASTTAPPSNRSSKMGYISQSCTRLCTYINDCGSVITGSIERNLHLLHEIRGAKDPEKADRRQKGELL